MLTPHPKTQEEWHAGRLEKVIDQLAAQLRSIADEVERTKGGISRLGKAGRTSYGSVAGDAQREIMHRIGQLRFDLLIETAAEADIARTKGA
jgi:hypothetical protein